MFIPLSNLVSFQAGASICAWDICCCHNIAQRKDGIAASGISIKDATCIRQVLRCCCCQIVTALF